VTFFFHQGATPEDLQNLGTMIKVVVTTLACAQLIKDEDDLFIALKIFVFSILFVYYQNSGELQQLRTAGYITEQDRFAGTLTNANTAAIFSLTVLWAAMLLLVRSGFRSLKVALYLVPVGLALLIIYYSGSKKGLLGLAMLALFMVRLLYIRRKSSLWQKSLVIGVSIVLVLVVGYFIYTSPFFFRMEQLVGGLSNISDVNRLDLVKEAVSVWLTNGLTFVMGVGYDQFWKFSSLGTYAHSTPVELLASNGLVGFLLFMGFLYLLWRKFVRLYRRASDQDMKSLFFAVMIFLLIYSFFMLAAVLHESRELLPILGCLAAFGRYHLRLQRAGANV
jgi:O-antigen ligase